MPSSFALCTRDLSFFCEASSAPVISRPRSAEMVRFWTVSLLIALRAFDGAQLDQARIGILVTALLAPLLAVASTAMVRPRVSTCPAA